MSCEQYLIQIHRDLINLSKEALISTIAFIVIIAFYMWRDK